MGEKMMKHCGKKGMSMVVLVYKRRFLGDEEAEIPGAWDVSPIVGRGILSIARIPKIMVSRQVAECQSK